MVQFKASTPATRKQVPVTQIQGVRTNIWEITVESVLKNMMDKTAIAVRMDTMVILIAKVCSYYLVLVPSRFQI